MRQAKNEQPPVSVMEWAANQVVNMKPRKLWPASAGTRRAIDDAERRSILRLVKEDFTQKEIASELGVDVKTISQVLKQERSKK